MAARRRGRILQSCAVVADARVVAHDPVCGLLAAGSRMPPVGTTALAGMLGLLLGYQNASVLIADGASLLPLAGMAGGAFVFLTLVTALVVSVKEAWFRIAIRVAGSWIAASGILLLGWSFRNVL